MDAYPDPEAFVPFVTCFEGARKSKLDAAPACAKSASLDYSPIAKCLADANRSAALDATMAKATVALGPSKAGTPWVILDGKHVEPTGLLQQVCDALGTDAPSGCDSS